MCFPCNQFGHQENSTGPEIMNALKHVRPGNGFEPKGIMFDKVGVVYFCDYTINQNFRKILTKKRKNHLMVGGCITQHEG